MVVATYVSFGIGGVGLEVIWTWKVNVDVAPVVGVGVVLLIIWTAVVVAASQQLGPFAVPPLWLHVEVLFLNRGTTSEDVVAFTV